MESGERHGRGRGQGGHQRPDEFHRDVRNEPGNGSGHEQGDRKDLKQCPTCKKEFKNLGAHKRFCKPDEPEIIIDNYMGKSLSSTVEEIENVLKSFRHEIDINVSKVDMTFKQVELKIRILVRR